jgi:hypothetical protein
MLEVRAPRRANGERANPFTVFVSNHPPVKGSMLSPLISTFREFSKRGSEQKENANITTHLSGAARRLSRRREGTHGPTFLDQGFLARPDPIHHADLCRFMQIWGQA